MLTRILPFLSWFKDYSGDKLRADLIGGVTVALVLIPQSMAYAQLAGLPAYYGLYAAFLPSMVAALFGSSRQLATGPVAVVSLMTAAALEPLAQAGSEAFIGYAILLALVVGLFQLTLGVLRLGVVVNFLSHPVVNGFTNAAAIIIATSQLSKLFGVNVDKAEHHYETVYRVAEAALNYTHWPTLALGILAFILMVGLKRFNPRIPNVLVAVVLTTVLSWAMGYERNATVALSLIEAPPALQAIQAFNTTMADLDKASLERSTLNDALVKADESLGESSPDHIKLKHDQELLNLHITQLKETARLQRADLRGLRLEGSDKGPYYLHGLVPSGVQGDGRIWRIRVGNRALDEKALMLMGGGAVVGYIPQDLKFAAPPIDLNIVLKLFSSAAIISLLGFMEAISIAKAMAAKTGQRLDPNQELIGQGLANIVGSIGQSYPVSGSFSRSAVNLQAGAATGLSSVFASVVVLLTLLFFTPLLYYLPQAVLAAIIMMAVLGLINVSGFIHAWRAQRYDGVISIISFACTLVFAPHLDKGIMVGVVLSLGFYLYRTMKPGVAVLALHPDGSLQDTLRHNLGQCKHIAVIRFDGSLFFANTSYLEDRILETVASMPHLRHLLIVSNGINELDASGEEMIALLVSRLREGGLEVSFSGVKDSVLDVLKRTRLYERIGEDHFFPTQAQAIHAIHARAHERSREKDCPLLKVCWMEVDEGQATRGRKRPKAVAVEQPGPQGATGRTEPSSP